MILGDAGVGKSKLLLRYKDKNAPIPYFPSKGVILDTHYLYVQNKKIWLNVWDASGQEQY